MKKLLIGGAAAAALSFGMVSSAAAQFPGFGSDTGPGFLITLNSNGTASFTSTSACPTYDGGGCNGDDTYIGVINNSGHSVGTIHLSSTQDIFGFDGDGIDAYGASGNAIDTSGYGGPQAYFTNIAFQYSPSFSETGDVNFIGGIKSGGTGYFSLEAALNTASFNQPITTSGTPEPATWAMMLMGFFGLGATLRRRKEVLA